MTGEPASLQPDAAKPQWEGSDAEFSTAKLSPKRSILNAAIVSLEYARQYLDKFLHWPDYILATHYYANVLAVTDSQENRNEAERCFKDVESWLQPGGKGRQFDEARKRIRAEAIYNRAVLLEKRGHNEEAKQLFESVLTLIGDNRQQPPRGVRFATEFALVMLIARDLGYAPVHKSTLMHQGAQSQPDNAEQIRKLRSDLQVAARSFLHYSGTEIEQLESKVDLADGDASDLESELDKIERRSDAVRKDKSRAVPEYARQVSKTYTRLNEARARITKASKDLAILRTMEAVVSELQHELFPSSNTVSGIEDAPSESSEA
jgi:tetratricopeptide (TPR) repeat protein